MLSVLGSHRPSFCSDAVARDGLERVKVADSASIRDLKNAIVEQLQIPEADILVSQSPELVSEMELKNLMGNA